MALVVAGSTNPFGGLNLATQFRITSNQTGDQDPLNAWEENDDATYSRVGSAVTQSSGIFSFPSTTNLILHNFSPIQSMLAPHFRAIENFIEYGKGNDKTTRMLAHNIEIYR